MAGENRTGIPNSLQEHWMPFTSNKSFKKDPRLITEAKGVYIKDHKGRTQIDASSGLFCNPLGHGRKEIISAITKQLETLDFVTPFQQGFGGSFELATKIAKLPKHLCRSVLLHPDRIKKRSQIEPKPIAKSMIRLINALI